jgi:hypothetical protein
VGTASEHSVRWIPVGLCWDERETGINEKRKTENEKCKMSKSYMRCTFLSTLSVKSLNGRFPDVRPTSSLILHFEFSILHSSLPVLVSLRSLAHSEPFPLYCVARLLNGGWQVGKVLYDEHFRIRRLRRVYRVSVQPYQLRASARRSAPTTHDRQYATAIGAIREPPAAHPGGSCRWHQRQGVDLGDDRCRSHRGRLPHRSLYITTPIVP